MTSINGNLNGIICINKPQDFTSFDVIAKLRGIMRVKRLGHAGTLDPMATGVLPIFVGRATKACDILPDHDKTYVAKFKLGATSDTQDIFGKILTETAVSDDITAETIEGILPIFRGEIEQIPPMYSAVRVNGQRLYDIARSGAVIEREPRKITIYTLNLLDYNCKTHEGEFEISCSRGTFIRTIIHDIGEKIGCGALMTSLVRTKACGFSLENCVTLEDLQKLSDENISAEKHLFPIEKVFDFMTKINLSTHQEKLYKNGIRLDIDKMDFAFSEENPTEKFAVYGSENNFIGTAFINFEKRELRVDKNFEIST